MPTDEVEAMSLENRAAELGIDPKALALFEELTALREQRDRLLPRVTRREARLAAVEQALDTADLYLRSAIAQLHQDTHKGDAATCYSIHCTNFRNWGRARALLEGSETDG